MKKSIGIREEKGKTRSVTERCSSPCNFTRAAKFRSSCEFSQWLGNCLALRNCLPATVPTAFDFITLLSLFGFLPNLSPCISLCFGYFGILYEGLAIKSRIEDIVRKSFIFFIKIFEGSFQRFPAFLIFSHFPSFSVPFSLAKHPRRMTTQKISG